MAVETFFVLLPSAQAVVRVIPFSARLKMKSSDMTVSDGNYKFTFRLYTQETGGSSVWSETVTIPVKNGVATTNLGEVTGIPSDLNFDGDNYFLGIKVNNDAEMTPRKKIGAVPMAINADTVDGAHAGTGAHNVLKLDAAGDVTIAGSWKGSTVSVGYGGTGFNTYTPGDLLYASGSSSFSRLGLGSDGQILTVVSGSIGWANASGGGGDITSVTASSGLAGGGSSGDVSLNLDVGHANTWTAAQIISNNFTVDTNTLFVDSSTHGVGLGTTSGITSRLTFATSTTAAGGILFGSDANLYRSASDTLTTDDALQVAGALSVGTTSSTYKINVAGAADNVTAAGITAINSNETANAGTILRVQSGTNSGTKASGFIGAFSNSYTQFPGFTNRLVVASNGSEGTGISFVTGDSSQDFRFLTNGSTERLRIASDGNIGVGTSSNINSRLTFAADTTAAGGLLFGTDTNLYRSAADTLKTDDALTVAGTLTASGTFNPGFTLGSVPFQDASGLAQNNGNLFWDNSTNRLGVGNSSPQTPLHATITNSSNVISSAGSFEHVLSSGTPAAGLGVALRFFLPSDTTAQQSAGLIAFTWADATHASRHSKGSLLVAGSSGSTVEAFAVETDQTVQYGYLSGNAPASSTLSKLRLGSAIASGSAAGTYLGVNAQSGFTGDLVNMQLNGSARWSVSNAGNITAIGAAGIGEAAPAADKLHVKGASNSTTTFALNVYNSDNANLFYVRDDGKARFLPQGTQNFGGEYVLNNSASDAFATNQFIVSNTDTTVGSHVVSRYQLGDGENGLLDVIRPANDQVAIAFGTRTSSQTYTEHVRIRETGFVGIGETSPDVQLVVKGNCANCGRFALSQTSSGGDRWDLISATNALHGVSDGSLLFWDNDVSAVRFTIQADGNIGIGTTSNINSKLTFAADTTAAGGILFGTDTNLYRSAADTLKTDDSLNVAANFTLSGTLITTPSTTQTLSAGNAILANAAKVKVAGSGGPVILTSTPTIADGTNGQLLYIQGTDDTNTLTVQDQTITLPSSNLELGSITRVLGKGDLLVLSFDSVDSVWYEVSFTNN